MKKAVQRILQKVLGFRTYLFLFSWFKIKTLKWDKKEGDFHHFLSLLAEDAQVWDIGANIGIMCVLLAKKCPKGQVNAVEPIPENFVALKRIGNHFGLKNVQYHQIALGEENGEVEMVMPKVSSVKMQGLSHVVHDSITDFNEGIRYKVPLHRLDDLLKNKRIDAIKIDVENFEYFVFSGGRESLKLHKPIIYCELWDNENRQKCFELLRDELGYSIEVLQNGELIPFDPKQHDNQNFFFR